MEEKDTKIIIAKRSCIACYENNERALGLEQRPLRFLFPSLETAIAQYRTNRDSANREAMHALEEALADSPERTLLLEIAKKVTKPTQPQRADEALVPLEDWEERQEKLFDDMCNIAGQYLSGESLQGKSALRMKAEALCRLLLDQMDYLMYEQK